MTERKIRYAVVGAGNIAQVAVLPAFANAAENSELVAIVSDDAEKRAALAKRYGLDQTGSYDELEQVIERAKVDAVYLAVPNALHRTFTERAARKGVHVLCEKPMAATVEDCEAMIRVCRERDVRLMIAYRLHFEEANLSAIEVVRSGQLGEPRIISSVFTQQVRADDIRTKKQLAGGAMFDMGVYCINASRYLFREEPEAVLASSWEGSDGRFAGVDETTTAILRFANGKVAQVTASLGAASISTFTVVGTRGSLTVEPAYDYTSDIVHTLTVEGKSSKRTFPKRDQFAPELITFSRAIAEGKDPEPSGEEGLADVRIVQAMFTSARTGQLIRLAPFSRARRPSLAQNIHKPAFEAPEPIHAPSPSQD
jgi:predicted dehydrogenase